MIHEKYEAVIGLEVHAQLLTASKLFCNDETSFGAAPNTRVSVVSLAHPGTLPVMNEKVIELAVKLGLSLNCDIVIDNYFARKNYFYPDLPKGYQVSQHTAPICLGGHINISTSHGDARVQLNRIHMEEDAGKSLHDIEENYTCIDLNRAGIPLLEIVTEPCMHHSEEALAYLTELRKIVRWLGVCDGNMEEGSMRCDANISIREKGDTRLGTKVEVKNLNSIRNVKRAIDFELARLIDMTENGEKIVQETRSYDADHNITFTLRVKEDADDYRYFPEPDLPPFNITDEYLESIRAAMPEMPQAVKQRYMSSFGLSDYDASQVTADKADIRYFELAAAHTTNRKAIANWMTGPLRSYLNEHSIDFDALALTPQKLAELINFTDAGKTSFSTASTKLFQALLRSPGAEVEALATQLNLLQESDSSAIEQWVDEAIASMPDKVKEYRSGKKGLIGLFAGEVKKRSKGKADMAVVNKLLQQKLS